MMPPWHFKYSLKMAEYFIIRNVSLKLVENFISRSVQQIKLTAVIYIGFRQSLNIRHFRPQIFAKMFYHAFTPTLLYIHFYNITSQQPVIFQLLCINLYCSLDLTLTITSAQVFYPMEILFIQYAYRLAHTPLNFRFCLYYYFITSYLYKLT